MSGGSSAPKAYNPTGQAAADQGYQNLTSTLAPYASQLPGYVLPLLQQITNSQVNSPYATGAQAGANTTGATATGTVAPMQLGGAASLYGTANAAGPAATTALNTGFDPQSALYAQQYQQQMDQQNAINAANGISGTPYAAGVSGQTANNFNLGWQNDQLARQAQAASTYGSLTGAAGGAYTGASNLGSAGINTLNTGYSLPYTTATGINNNASTALNNYSAGVSGASAPATSLANLFSQYLGLGQSATQINDQATQINNAEQNSIFSGLGNLFSQVLGGGSTGNDFGGGLLSFIGA